MWNKQKQEPESLIQRMVETARTQRLELEPGDILLVKLGIADMGDGFPPWIPSTMDCEYAKKEWEQVVPDGVKVLVTHFGTVAEIVKVGDTSLPGRIIALENAVKQLNDKREIQK